MNFAGFIGRFNLIIIPDEGKLEIIRRILKDALSVDEDLIFHLYKNNLTLGHTTEAADFTEADFDDYTTYELDRSDWNSPIITGHKSVMTYNTTLSWTCGATGNRVYGYWLEGATSNVCWYAEEFDSPIDLEDTDVLNIIPKFTFSYLC